MKHRRMQARPSSAVPIRLGIALVALAVAGCASFAPPRPWEKGGLAKPAMRFDGDVLAAKATQHVYQSREAASAGGSVGGGGCGCN